MFRYTLMLPLVVSKTCPLPHVPPVQVPPDVVKVELTALLSAIVEFNVPEYQSKTVAVAGRLNIPLNPRVSSVFFIIVSLF
jgi:hypothetical protein